MPALAEARRVGPRGNVVGTDTSEAMLSLAREYAQAEGLTNVEFRAADAGALPFEDEAFDRVTSGFGAMYFPDLSRAIAESFRVLRPGGRLTWLAWGPFDQPFFLATAQVAMRHAGISELPREAAQPFCFSGGGILQRAVQAAGFEEVRETSHEVFSSWPGAPEEAWGPAVPGDSRSTRRRFSQTGHGRNNGNVAEILFGRSCQGS